MGAGVPSSRYVRSLKRQAYKICTTSTNMGTSGCSAEDMWYLTFFYLPKADNIKDSAELGSASSFSLGSRHHYH